MPAAEPVLYPEDHLKWRMWERLCRAHARSRAFARAVEEAKGHIEIMSQTCPDAHVAWSPGKDSTAMAHLVCVEMGVGARLMSIHDDTDFPGEVAYQERLAKAWGVHERLDLLFAPRSVRRALADAAREGTLSVLGDLRSRQAHVAQWSFYDLVEQYENEAGKPGVYLGLRAQESRGRASNWRVRGEIYTKRDTQTVCQPLATWRQEDVFAYLFSREIDVFPVYRCLHGYQHPGEVRLDGWVPGSFGASGEGIWLRRHWPSLYAAWQEIWPEATCLA